MLDLLRRWTGAIKAFDLACESLTRFGLSQRPECTNLVGVPMKPVDRREEPLKLRAFVWTRPSPWLLLPILLMIGTGTRSQAALTLLSSNELVFVNVDHAPMGACSTITYGYNGQPCGVGTSLG